ncbi:MAG TPA: hypothetical protein VHE12_06475 [bacterium]|nr:hypothetical protein [bacterium]
MGLMDLFGKKSTLLDTNQNLVNAPGKLSGAPSATAEGDFHARFVPDDKKYLLNINQTANPSGLLDLKVKLLPQGVQPFLQAVQSMQNKPIFVSGVLANDQAFAHRVVVQPLDMIYSPEDPEQYPGWFKAIQGNLKDPNAVAVYKVVAASDASKSAKPPRADESRTLKAVFPYPPKPNFPKIKLDFEVRASLNVQADFRPANMPMKERVELEVTLETAKENGPGVFVGDLVIYWGNE